MSNYQGGGGRGRGRSGRGGGRSRGGGRGGGRGGSDLPQAKFRPCKSWTTSGSCPNGNNCNFGHIVQLHANVDASSYIKNNNSNNYGHPQQKMAMVSSVAIWETAGQIKIFTGSHDGYWRLWNTTGGSFRKDFEQNMRGKVECLQVVNNFLFCGFEAVSRALPQVTVGMVHIWNLATPSQPPLELHMNSDLLPYAHNQAVTALCIAGEDPPKVVSGSKDGSIRLWTYENNKFHMAASLPGHAREVTGLVLLPSNVLWSCGIDGAIRIWDTTKGTCQHCIVADKGAAAPNAQQQPGHTHAVTALLSYNSPAGVFVLSSSLDGTIKAWNGVNGECVASESHGEGVVSMSLAKDAQNNELLLIGLESGNIMCRNLVQTARTPAFQLLFSLVSKFSVGHQGAVKSVAQGPAATFYTVGADGKMLVFQFTGDLGIK